MPCRYSANTCSHPFRAIWEKVHTYRHASSFYAQPNESRQRRRVQESPRNQARSTSRSIRRFLIGMNAHHRQILTSRENWSSQERKANLFTAWRRCGEWESSRVAKEWRDAEPRGTSRNASTRVQSRGMLAVYYCAETTPNDCRAAAAAAACRPTNPTSRPTVAAAPTARTPSREPTEKWVEKLYGVWSDDYWPGGPLSKPERYVSHSVYTRGRLHRKTAAAF